MSFRVGNVMVIDYEKIQCTNHGSQINKALAKIPFWANIFLEFVKLYC